MENLKNRTVADLVVENYRTADVFKKYGIDFCCGGNKSIETVCRQKNVNQADLLNELKSVNHGKPDAAHDYSHWTLSELMDYIVKTHHAYVNANVELINGYAEKVAKVHGDHNPETVQILGDWKKLVSELVPHMKKEELILFPYIRNVERTSTGDLKELPRTHFGSVKSPIRMMVAEHEDAGTIMEEIRSLSNNFTPPVHACNTYKVLYAMLEEFENDLHNHVHLENNILFPKAITLEEQLKSLEAH